MYMCAYVRMYVRVGSVGVCGGGEEELCVYMPRAYVSYEL